MSKSGSSQTAQSVVREFEIVNRLGIHARPATLFVKTASQFECDISVEMNGNRVSGKSIMGLLTLAASRGSTMKVVAEGPDAVEALEAIRKLIESKFDEE